MESAEAKRKKVFRFGAWVFVAVVVLWLAWGLAGVQAMNWYWSWRGLDPATELAPLGQIGDIFGGINALFAAFAFGGVAIAAYFQYQTMLIAEDANTTQRRESARQAFEVLFFHLLRESKDLLPARLVVPGSLDETAFVGDFQEYPFQVAVSSIRAQLKMEFGESIKNVMALDSSSQATVILKIGFKWDTIQKLNLATLEPYFRTLYHVFKLIAQAELSSEDERRYAEIARASLSSQHVLLLALNCGVGGGIGRFAELVKKFNLLKHHAGANDLRSFDRALVDLFRLKEDR